MVFEKKKCGQCLRKMSVVFFLNSAWRHSASSGFWNKWAVMVVWSLFPHACRLWDETAVRIAQIFTKSHPIGTVWVYLASWLPFPLGSAQGPLLCSCSLFHFWLRGTPGGTHTQHFGLDGWLNAWSWQCSLPLRLRDAELGTTRATSSGSVGGAWCLGLNLNFRPGM